MRVSNGDCHLGWAVLEEALSKYCGNQQPFIELLEEGPRSCQEVFGDLTLNLFFNSCWHSVLPGPGAGCKGMLALSCVLVLISQEDLPRAQGSDVKKNAECALESTCIGEGAAGDQHAAAPSPKEPSHGPLIFP